METPSGSTRESTGDITEEMTKEATDRGRTYLEEILPQQTVTVEKPPGTLTEKLTEKLTERMTGEVTGRVTGEASSGNSARAARPRLL